MFKLMNDKKGNFIRSEYHHGHFLVMIRTDRDSPFPNWRGTELWFTHRECDPVQTELRKAPILMATGSLSDLERESLAQNPEEFMKDLLLQMVLQQLP